MIFLGAFLRLANVRRRTLCWGLYSGEAAVVGGNHLFGCSPPVENLLTGACTTKSQPSNNLPSPSQLEAGFFSSPILHLLITVIYCLSKGRGGRFG